MNKAKLNPRTGGKSNTLPYKKSATLKSSNVPKLKADADEQKEIKNQQKCCILQ